MKPARTAAVLLAALALAGEANMTDAQEWTFDVSTLRPFTQVQRYLDQHETGLYPGGGNEMPQTHRQAGERIAATIVPLDAAGQPDPRGGRILAMVMGHSNCNMYFSSLQQRLRQEQDKLHERFEMLNAAVGGQQLPEIRQLQGKVWAKAAELLDRPGYSNLQVQVLFLHTTFHQWKNVQGRPPGPFPQTMQRMQADIEVVLKHCLKLYPNLKLVYLTADGMRYYTGFEPHVWQEAFAIKWLIEAQLRDAEGMTYAPGPDGQRAMPWLCWGPYIWDNTWDAGYFTDGVHPAAKAREIFVNKYWQHLQADPVARAWMFRAPTGAPAEQAQP